MKPATLLLTVSLLLNLAFGCLVWRARASALTSAAVAAAAPQPSASSTQLASPPGTRSPVAALRPPLWTGMPVEATPDSIGDAIERLRQAGCSPREIHAVVETMILEIFQQKSAGSGFSNETLPYWQQFRRVTDSRPADEFADAYRERLRLERTYLLTPGLFAAGEERLEATQLHFGVKDPEKLRRLAILESESVDQSLSRRQGPGTSTRPGESRFGDPTRTEAEERMRRETAAVAAILSPEEFAEYDLRNSEAARMLRYELESFRPTEAEYKALFSVVKAHGDHLTEKAAQEKYLAAAKAVLSPERAADYEAAQKAGGDLVRLMARLDLPLATATYLNEVRDQTATKAQAILASAQLTPAQRTAQLNALASETESNLAATLGSQRALDAYKALKGDWLHNLRKTTSTGY